MKPSPTLLLVLPLMLLFNSCAMSTALQGGKEDVILNETNTPVNPARLFSYKPYSDVLQTYVDARGLVNYKNLRANRQQLDEFNASLATISPSTYESWTTEEQIAFWINAYNSFTLQAIIEHYPTQSIRDISGVWNRLKFRVMGKEMTLDEIEHETLRKLFNEPRIHMALVCASIGCPLLRKEPYVGEKLDEQLDDQTGKFLALDRNFKLNRDRNEVYVSSIFKWFGEDFESNYSVEDQFGGNKKERSVLNFISNYMQEEEREYLIRGDYKVKYLDYDWSLNAQSN